MEAVTLRELNDANRDTVVRLSVAPAQEPFVGSVAEALEDAATIPEGNPWYRAIYAGDEPVGFVMLSWDAPPDPPTIIGPWFLWKLIIDERHQRLGYGREAVRLVADLVRAQGATELLTSYAQGDGDPSPFYRGLGFRPTGELDDEGEIIVSLDLSGHERRSIQFRPAIAPVSIPAVSHVATTGAPRAGTGIPRDRFRARETPVASPRASRRLHWYLP